MYPNFPQALRGNTYTGVQVVRLGANALPRIEVIRIEISAFSATLTDGRAVSTGTAYWHVTDNGLGGTNFTSLLASEALALSPASYDEALSTDLLADLALYLPPTVGMNFPTVSPTAAPTEVTIAAPTVFPTVAYEFAICPDANFSRPADTTPYAVGDLIANSTVANLVTPLELWNAVREPGMCGRVDRIRLYKSGPSIANASFRVHLFGAIPTPVNGDNGVFSSNLADCIGQLDVTMDRSFTNGAYGVGIPSLGNSIQYQILSGTAVYALIEARAAYGGVSGENFKLVAEMVRF